MAHVLGTNIRSGLTAEEAQDRLERHGRNELRAATTIPWWRRLLSQFQDPLVYLLLGAVVVSFVAWILERHEPVPIDAMVIAAIVVLNAALGYVQEARAADAVAALARMTAVTSSVVRDGVRRRIPSAELVPGDLLLLEEGDPVGADARLVQASALQIQEASLTGESASVSKDVNKLQQPAPLAERTSMVFKGTAVTQGSGLALVTATGMRTEIRLTQLDYDRDIAFVALEPSGELAGIVRYTADPDGARAEFGLLVRSDLKRLGLGRALMEHLLRYARARGIGELFGLILRENTAMVEFATQLGFSVAANTGDPDLAEVTLPLRPH